MRSFNEPRLPWKNLSKTLTQGTSQLNLTGIGEELHPGEQ